MARHFNGTYSVRAGYHGAHSQKSSGASVGRNFILCKECNRYIPRTAFDEHTQQHAGSTPAAQQVQNVVASDPA